MENSNLQIVKRLLELSKNQLEYSIYPKQYNKEYIFLANILNSGLKDLEQEFKDAFRCAVGNYKQTLKESKKYGWFHKPEKLVYLKMQINQVKYVIYGDMHVREIKFNEKLGNAAYKDLIEQIDRTVLMTAKQLKAHHLQINKLSLEIMNEILKE